MPNREELVKRLETIDNTIVSLEAELAEARQERGQTVTQLGRDPMLVPLLPPSDQEKSFHDAMTYLDRQREPFMEVPAGTSERIRVERAPYREVQVHPAIFTREIVPVLTANADGSHLEAHIMRLVPVGRDLHPVERSLCGREWERWAIEVVSVQEDATEVDLCSACERILRIKIK